MSEGADQKPHCGHAWEHKGTNAGLWIPQCHLCGDFDDADLGEQVAKIKADALRVAAIQVTTQVENASADETEDPGAYYHGAAYGMRKTAHWMHRRADRIETGP